MAHILVAWSGPDDDPVVAHAARMACDEHARLTVAFVQRRPHLQVWPCSELLGPAEHAWREAQAALIGSLRTVVDRLPQDLSVMTIVRLGPVSAVLVDSALEHRCCSIVTSQAIGSRGHARIARAARRRHAGHLRLISYSEQGSRAVAPRQAHRR